MYIYIYIYIHISIPEVQPLPRDVPKPTRRPPAPMRTHSSAFASFGMAGSSAHGRFLNNRKTNKIKKIIIIKIK